MQSDISTLYRAVLAAPRDETVAKAYADALMESVDEVDQVRGEMIWGMIQERHQEIIEATLYPPREIEVIVPMWSPFHNAVSKTIAVDIDNFLSVAKPVPHAIMEFAINGGFVNCISCCHDYFVKHCTEMFNRFPITCVKLTDKRPGHTPRFNGNHDYALSKAHTRQRYEYLRDAFNSRFFPFTIFLGEESKTEGYSGEESFLVFPDGRIESSVIAGETVDEANWALSDYLVAHGRKKVGLPWMPSADYNKGAETGRRHAVHGNRKGM